MRPTSVTAIGWIIVVTAAVGLLYLPLSIWFVANNTAVRDVMGKNPVPIPLQFGIGAVGLLFRLLAGIFILKGANWARLLYTILGGIGLVYAFLTSPAKTLLVPGIMFYAVIVFFLFTPKANAYFTTSANADNS